MDNRVLFGIMCIIFNSYGVPCFMQGNVGKGIARIILGVVTCGVIGIINVIKGIILGKAVIVLEGVEPIPMLFGFGKLGRISALDDK